MTAAIVVSVDGSSSGGIELMALMVVSLMVVVVDGSSKDGIFNTNSHDDDHHPCSPLDVD